MNYSTGFKLTCFLWNYCSKDIGTKNEFDLLFSFLTSCFWLLLILDQHLAGSV